MHIFFPNYEHHRATHSVEEAAARHTRAGATRSAEFRRPESRETETGRVTSQLSRATTRPHERRDSTLERSA